MPEKANEHAPTDKQHSQAETTAGKPSPTALPAVDEEVICQWMEPKPIGKRMGRSVRWWAWWNAPEAQSWNPIELTLDALWEVEERLRLDQWKPYVEQLLKWKSLDRVYVEQLFWLLHVTREQKIKALAAVIRSSAPDSTRKRDGVAGDVQPLRPRE